MKRFIVAFVALVIAMVTISGCGGSKQEAAQKPEANNEQQQTNTSEPAKNETIADILAKGTKIEGMSYDYTMTMGQEVVSGKVWLQGKKMKTETEVAGIKAVIIFDGDANTAYSYMPAQNIAMKLPMEEREKVGKTPLDYIKDADPNATAVTENTILDGVPCKVITVKNAATGDETKMWVREDYGVPMKVEAIAKDGVKTLMEFKNFEVGSLPDDTFTLPAGVKINDLGNMMKKLPKMPQIPNQ